MKILISEDDAVSRRLLEARLHKWGYEVLSTENGDEAMRALKSDDAPLLAILDWNMPGKDGVDICKEIREIGNEPYTYIILLTARQDKADLITAMRAGADDYLTKPFDPTELEVRLRAGRRIVALQEQLIAARENFRMQATHDTLTGLLNRTALNDLFRSEMERAKRHASAISVLMCDLDHFKKVNDTYGHLAGDAVLREAANRMSANLRIYDHVARYGGEEFVLLLPDSNAEQGLSVAERIRRAMESEPVNTYEGLIPVTISIGLAALESVGDQEIETMISAADAALYRAKRSGRNRVELATAEEFNVSAKQADEVAQPTTA